MKNRIMAFRFLTALVLMSVAVEASAQGRAARVGVDPVVVESLAETVPVIGRVVASQEGDVASKVSGPVAEMLVQVGDRVEAGTTLAIIDPVRIELERDMAESDYDAAVGELLSTRKQIELLQQELARMENLRQSAAFSRASYDDKTKQIAVEQARMEAQTARVSMARARLELRATDVNDTRIKAPFDGVIVRKHVSAGAYVRIGDPIVELVNDSTLEIEADVPAERMGGLGEGTVVGAVLEDRDTIDVRFRAVVPVENTLTRTRAVRFVPISEEAAGKVDTSGESVTISIPVGAVREVVTVHKDAVTISQGQRMVFRAEGDKAVPQPIQVGGSVGGRFEVIDGSLEPGDIVVIRGNERLRPGQQIAYDGMPVNENGEDGGVKPATSGSSKSENSGALDRNRASSGIDNKRKS